MGLRGRRRKSGEEGREQEAGHGESAGDKRAARQVTEKWQVLQTFRVHGCRNRCDGNRLNCKRDEPHFSLCSCLHSAVTSVNRNF